MGRTSDWNVWKEIASLIRRMIKSLSWMNKTMMTIAVLFNNDEHEAMIIWQQSLGGGSIFPSLSSAYILQHNMTEYGNTDA